MIKITGEFYLDIFIKWELWLQKRVIKLTEITKIGFHRIPKICMFIAILKRPDKNGH